MAIAFECPVCEFQGKVADDQQGKEMVCKGCGHKWTLSGPAAASGASAATVTATATTTTTAPPKPASGELIATQCPACKTKGKVPAAARGKKVKCPKCSEAFVVGQVAPPPAQPSGPAAKLSDADEPPAPEEPDPAPKEPGLGQLKSPSKALAEVKAPDDVGLAPLEGAEVVEDEEKEKVYDLVDDAAILIDTICPGCKHKGTVPEKFAGKKVKCPRCSAMFVVGGTAGPNPPARQPGSSPGVKKPAASPPPAEDNPFADLDAPGPVKIKPAAAPADENPFAFDAPAPSTPAVSAAKDADRPAPASRPGRGKLERKLEDEEARVNTYMMGIAGGITLISVLVGGFVLLRVLNAPPATKDTGTVAAVTPTEPQAPPAPRQPPEPVAPETKPRTKRDPVPVPDARPKLDLPLPPDPAPKEPGLGKSEPMPEPAPKEPGLGKGEPRKEPTWLDASRESAKVGDVNVRVTAAWIDFPKGPAGVSPKKFLLIQVQLENQSADKQADYQGWSVPEAVPGKAAPARLTDPVGKILKLATPQDTVIKPAGQLRREFLMPTQTLDDLLIFEAPAKTPEYLRLELPAENIGGTGSLGLQLPGTMITGSAATTEPLVKGNDPPPDKAMATKIAQLRDIARRGLPAQRESAIKTLGELGAAAAPAVPDLMGYLNAEKNEMIRAAAAEALGKIGPPAKVAINTLIRALGDEFWRVKANACEALANFGPDAKEAVPILQKLMKSNEEEVPTKAALALSKIDQRGRPPVKAPPPPPPKGVQPPPKGAPVPPPKAPAAK
jgi:predicted Zn finger-like uncharacterized protein